MPDIILKDRNGNPVTHEAVKHLKVKNSSNVETLYTCAGNYNRYYATYDSSTEKFTITGSCIGFSLEGGYILGLPDTPIENGYIVLTTKTLTKGNTYYKSELGGV